MQNRQQRRFGPAGLALALAASGAAHAQQAGAQAPAPRSQSSPTSSDSVLGEIVVTAQKRAERLQDVPLSVTAVTGAALQKAGVATVRDLPNVVPGLTFSSQGAWQEPAIRGVTTSVTSAGAENPVAIYLDGIYQPSQTASVFDLPDVSRVEVLKGPQGTLFGRNATGGAIQIFTLDPSFTPTGDVTLTYGAYEGGAKVGNEGGVKGYVSGPLVGDVLAGGVSFFYNRNDGYLQNDVNGKKTGGATSQLIRGKLLYEPTSALKIVASAYYTHRTDLSTEAGLALNGVSAGTQYPGAIAATQPWHTSYDTPQPLYRTEAYGGSLRIDDTTDYGVLSSLTGYTHARATEHVDVDATYSPACLAVFACTDYRVSTPEEAVSEEIDFASKQYGPLSFIAGLFIYHDKGTLAGLVDPTVVPGGIFSFEHQVVSNAYAGFTEITLRPTDRLTLIGGLRYNYDQKINFGETGDTPLVQYQNKVWHALTPRYSARYDIAHNINAYFTYSEGFKSGVFSDEDFKTPPANPEVLRSYELGLKIVQPAYSLNAALFHYKYTNLQVQYFNGIDAFPANAATATINGLDLDATWRATPALTFHGGLSYIPHAEYDKYDNAIIYGYPLTPGGLTTYNNVNVSGSRLVRTPKVTANLGGDYTRELTGGALTASATASYSSSYDWELSRRVRTGAYTTLATQIAYKPDGSHYRFVVFGKNLTNAAYINSTLLDATADMVFYAPPREIGVQVEYSF